ncbi:MAG: hypothetical protein JSS02_34040 [Planctomycetes bacterium]|nr:hypothetical protein [Planctomycetota bacterium]
MTTVAILPVSDELGRVGYRAVAGRLHSEGTTAGQALDGLASQLPQDESETLVVVQHRQPDRHFTSRDQRRVEELMTLWRAARDSGTTFPEVLQIELDQLVELEVRGATERATRLLDELGR